jgi:hypothetical protein
MQIPSFFGVNDLAAIRGIGPKRLKMRKYLTVGKPAPAAANTAQPGKKQTSRTHKARTHKICRGRKSPPRPPSTEQPAPETEEP